MADQQRGLDSKASPLRRALIRVCPHWYWPVPNYGMDVLSETKSIHRCKLCGKFKVHVRMPEPHPTRDKHEELEKMQRPEYEIVVDEWLPYGSMMPDFDKEGSKS